MLVHDYTAISTLAACPRRYKHRYIDRLEPTGVSVPRHAGTAMHAAFERLYARDDWDYDRARVELDLGWGNFKTPFGDKHSYMHPHHLHAVLDSYMQDRERNPTQLETGDIIGNLSEETLIVTLENGARIGGRPDIAIAMPNGLYIVDHKFTTSWINDYWALKYRVGHQLRVYAVMLEERMGQRFEGGFINAVYIGEKAADPPEKWERRKSAPNRLIPISFTPALLDETREWIAAWQTTAATFEAMGSWPQNEGACADWGGCEFMPLCKVGSEAAKRGIAAREFLEWEPTGKLLSGADNT